MVAEKGTFGSKGSKKTDGQIYRHTDANTQTQREGREREVKGEESMSEGEREKEGK